jgi:hypothetical protein
VFVFTPGFTTPLVMSVTEVRFHVTRIASGMTVANDHYFMTLFLLYLSSNFMFARIRIFLFIN